MTRIDDPLSVVNKCVTWILEEIGNGKVRELTEINKKGEKVGFSRQVIHDARIRIGDRIILSGNGRKRYWQLRK